MTRSRILVFTAAAFVIVAFFYFDLAAYFQLDYLKSEQSRLAAQVADEPLRSATTYVLIYVVVTALSLPGAVILTLIGGAIFGFVWGTLLVSLASTLGATGAFLLSRYLFRDTVSKRFQTKMKAINQGISTDGAFYLFTLRLVPIFPFFVINLVMGLTSLGAWTFLFVSQLGMFPGTLVFVNAGT